MTEPTTKLKSGVYVYEAAAGIGHTLPMGKEDTIEEYIERMVPHMKFTRIPKYPTNLDPSYLSLLRLPRPDLLSKYDTIFPINEMDILARYMAIVDFFTDERYAVICRQEGTSLFFSTFDRLTEMKRRRIRTRMLLH